MASIEGNVVGDKVLGGPPRFDGLDATRRMLNSDIPLQTRFPSGGLPGSNWTPYSFENIQAISGSQIQDADIKALQEYVQSIDTNYVIPPEKSSEEAEGDKGPEVEVEGGTFEMESKDGGVGDEWRRGISRDLQTGKVTRNPDGTYELDNDFRGKWEESQFNIIEGKISDEASVAVAEGSFGDENSFISGEGSALGAQAGYEFNGSLGNQGLNLGAEASAGAQMLEGSVKTSEDGLLKADASGSVMSAEAKGSVEAVLSPEKATLGGELGASVNVIEGKIGGDFCWTPRRVTNFYVNSFNWIVGTEYEGLSEDWDIGVCVGGEVGAQVGAQAGVDGKVGYEDGKATAEAGAKLGLGVGASAKARGGVVGLDKVWGHIKGLFGGGE